MHETSLRRRIGRGTALIDRLLCGEYACAGRSRGRGRIVMSFPRILTVSSVIVTVAGICAAVPGQAATPSPLPYRSAQAGLVAKVHPSPRVRADGRTPSLHSKGARRLATVVGPAAAKGAVVSGA